MGTKVVMPPLGDSSNEATVLRWLKQEGETVSKGELLFEIETDKATLEIEAYDTGVLHKILVSAGETVEVGTPLAIIAAPDEDLSDLM